MFITLFSIAITALVGTPIAVRAVKRRIERRQAEELYEDRKNRLAEQEEASEELARSQMAFEGNESALISLEDPAPSPPTDPFARQLPASKGNTLVQIDWGIPSEEEPGSPKPQEAMAFIPPWESNLSSSLKTPLLREEKQGLESQRPTLSADQLFQETASQHFEISPQTSFPNDRNIDKRQHVEHGKKSKDLKNKRNIQPIHSKSVEESSSTSPKLMVERDGDSEKHFLHSQQAKLKIREPSRAGRRKPAVVRMMITEAPTGLPNREHFEVIQPVTQKVSQDWRMEGEPENRLEGEQLWHSVQPMYIDFIPFFSLDALININDHLILNKSSHQRSALQTPKVEEPVEEDEVEETSIPEWQSLLGQVNGFLFQMKLRQQSLPSHAQLTAQSLESSLSFDLTQQLSRPPAGIAPPIDIDDAPYTASSDELSAPMSPAQFSHPRRLITSIHPDE
jgi:hypothetical protein